MPADVTAVQFTVHGGGHTLVGLYDTAGTPAPAPFALLLHGIPGSEKNHDLAHALRARGWNVLVLHFSGTWGSGGLYDIASHPRDASAAIDFALSPNAPAQIDARNIVVIGYSFGSRAALFTAYQDPRVTAVISIGGFADFSEVMFDRSFYESVSPFLNGTTPDSLIAQLNTLGGGLQPYEVVEQLTVPTLIVHGDADEVVPFYNALALAGKRADVAVVEGANHVFGDHRPQLIAAVTEFMAEITP